MEASVRLFRATLACKHPRRVLLFALEGEDACRVGEAPGEVLLGEPPDTVGPSVEAGMDDLRERRAGHRFDLVVDNDLPPSHLVTDITPGVRLGLALPLLEGRQEAFGHVCSQFFREDREVSVRYQIANTRNGLEVARHNSGVCYGLVVGADRVSNLREVTDATARNDRVSPGASFSVANLCKRVREAVLDDAHDPLVELLGAVVIEARRNGRNHREVLVSNVECFTIAPDLFADIPEGIVCPATVGLVDGDHVSEIKHVNLLELGGCAVLGRHDVHGDI